MEKYKLKKDTFFYKAGTICKLTPKGNMVLEDSQGTCLLHNYQFDSHPGLLDEWFEKIKKKYGGRVPKKGDTFWFISSCGAIAEETWDDDPTDHGMFELGSAFWTKEEAEKGVKRRKAYMVLKEDTKGFVPDWRNNIQMKYYACYDYTNNELDFGIDYSYKANGNDFYFATEKDVRASIKDHKKLWLDYLGIEEEK